MTGPNGHADSSAAVFANGEEVGPAPACIRTWDGSNRFTHDEIKRYTDELEVPFDPRVIEWRVTNTSCDKSRGQIIPYAAGYKLDAVSIESWTCPLRIRKAPRHGWPIWNRTVPLSLSTGVAISCSCLRTSRGRVFLDIEGPPKGSFPS